MIHAAEIFVRVALSEGLNHRVYPGNPAGAGTCPRQKATNPDTGEAPPPLPSRRLHGLGGDIRRLPVQGSPGRLKPQSVIRKARMFESSPVHQRLR